MLNIDISPSIADIRTISWNQITNIQQLKTKLATQFITSIPPESARSELIDKNILVLSKQLLKLKSSLDNYNPSLLRRIFDLFTGVFCKVWRLRRSLAEAIDVIYQVAQRLKEQNKPIEPAPVAPRVPVISTIPPIVAPAKRPVSTATTRLAPNIASQTQPSKRARSASAVSRRVVQSGRRPSVNQGRSSSLLNRVSPIPPPAATGGTPALAPLTGNQGNGIIAQLDTVLPMGPAGKILAERIDNRHLIQVKDFKTVVESLITQGKLNREDFEELKKSLAETPDQGDVITGTGGIRKVRLKSATTGKSSGFRVCYLNLEDRSMLFLLVIFAKHDQENLSEKEKASLKHVAGAIKKRVINE